MLSTVTPEQDGISCCTSTGSVYQDKGKYNTESNLG